MRCGAILPWLGAASLGAQAPRLHLPRGDTLYRHASVAHQFHGCPIGGRSAGGHAGGNVFDSRLNALKNRIDQPTGYVAVRPSAILELASPNLKASPRARWPRLHPDEAAMIATYEGLPVTIEGYLAVDRRMKPVLYGAAEEGSESTNCGVAKHGGDVHVWITPDVNQNLTAAIVAELTPRVREALSMNASRTQAMKLTAAAKRGLQVRVSGWLMFDEDHPEQLIDHVRKNAATQWQRRATLWEIHPVLRFEIKDGNGWLDLTTWTP